MKINCPIPKQQFALKTMLVVLLLNVGFALAAPNADLLTWAVGIAPEDLPRLQKGEIVSFSVSEPIGKSLVSASGIAMYVKTPPSKIVELVKRRSLLAADPDVIAHGDLYTAKGPKAFNKFAYSAAQADEARRLLDAKAGTDFNLSSQEIASFRALKARVDQGNGKAVAEAVSDNYRKLLADRLRAYWHDGLSGIAAYDRGYGETAEPGAELAKATRESRVLERYFSDLQQLLLRAPITLTNETESQFFWINRKVEERPTPILVHRLTYALKDGAVMVQREFYVGHSYNSSQAMAASLPYQDGAIVLYGVRSASDQGAGMGQASKDSIGREHREQLNKEIIKKFQRLKATLKG